MRGKDEQQLDVFSYINPEQRVPQDHPLRSLRAMTDEALQQLQPRFNRLYAKTGRPSTAPERLLRALLLQALYSGAQRTNADGTTRLQLAVPLVCGLEHGDSIWDVTVSLKTASACSTETSPKLSSKLCYSRQVSGICSRTNTSQWMEHCWKHRRV